jgi:SAM-dependent methyltransferase
MTKVGLQKVRAAGDEASEVSSLADVRCPLCDGEECKYLFWTKDYTFKCSDEVFRVNRCAKCGCGYVSPRPAEQDIGRYYPQEFYWSWEGSDHELDWSVIIEKRKLQLEAKARWLKGVTPGLLLDIGAQKGEFIWFMRQFGWKVEGVEMSTDVPNPADLPIKYGDFLDIDFSGKLYDVVTFWAVLEHVYNPAQFIEKAVALLKPGGRLVVLVTNLNSIQSRFYQADDFPRHLTLFTKRSVRSMCVKYGLNLEKVSTTQDIFGGSLGGGLLHVVKRLFGYSSEEVLEEWKQLQDPELFWCKWRGKSSFSVKMVSRMDKLITRPIEKVLDKMGYGFILTFMACKPSDVESRNV